MSSLLPAHSGLLPYWLLFTSAAGIFNTIACYTSPELGRRLYQGSAARKQVTDLSTRLFGTWTVLSVVVRTYAAYNLDNKEVYAITLFTYAIVSGFFASEWLVYKTVKPGKEIAPTFAVATISLTWMLVQWGTL
ncbi:hypothetical protein HYFRA_00003821 [Hymenoscyphus fraxineus]|uniref:Uncharacterized protein n=1 Tax=Hymenoscyphus fraxineus TaxID=746836 RepID=A0A9N9PWB8_9HELO|nr:hypothetical protein HYFRA_00003821 [Hymenoscyphus fraxineus]